MLRKRSKTIIVNDLMQSNYRYQLTEPVGRNFASDFKPELSPAEMLALGVFGGKYLNDCRREFPASWYRKAKLNLQKHDSQLNFFGVNASQSLAVWRQKGWINPIDPRGWFQWYCRYFLGRRLEPEDRRQIKRWRAIRRHVLAIKKNCRRGDLNCRRRQRQAVLHWAYDSRKF